MLCGPQLDLLGAWRRGKARFSMKSVIPLLMASLVIAITGAAQPAFFRWPDSAIAMHFRVFGPAVLWLMLVVAALHAPSSLPTAHPMARHISSVENSGWRWLRAGCGACPARFPRTLRVVTSGPRPEVRRLRKRARFLIPEIMYSKGPGGTFHRATVSRSIPLALSG